MATEAPRFQATRRRLLLNTYPLEYQPSPRLSFFKELVGSARLKEVKNANSWRYGLGASVQLTPNVTVTLIDTYGFKVDRKVVDGRKYNFDKPRKHPVVVVKERNKYPVGKRRTNRFYIHDHERVLREGETVYIEGKDDKGMPLGLAIPKNGIVRPYTPSSTQPTA